MMLRFHKPRKRSVGLASLTDSTSGPLPNCQKGTVTRRNCWGNNFNHDVWNSPQHSHLVHFAIWRKYWEMWHCVATQVSFIGTRSNAKPLTYSLTTGNLSRTSSLQISAKSFPAALKFCFSNSASVVLLCESKWVSKVSWRRTPASACLRGTILFSMLLYADILGASVDTSITSKLFLKVLNQNV